MIYSFLYVLLNALSALLRQIGGDFMSPAYILLIGSVCAILFYHAINFSKLKNIYQKCLEQKKLWFNCNLSIAFIWICAVYSPPMIGAGLYTFLFFAVVSLCGRVSLYLQQKQQRSISHQVSILALILLLSFVVASNAISHVSVHEWFGMLLASLGGVWGFIYAKQAAVLMKAKLSASQLLAVRFYATIVFCIILIALKPSIDLNIAKLSYGLITGIVCLIVPVYFMQKGIEKAGPELNAIICGAMPLTAAIFQQAYYHSVSLNYFIIYILYGFFAIYPLVMQKFKRAEDRV